MRQLLACACALTLLGLASLAEAQCGARLSQCRNCHEIAGTRPVLAGPGPWHRDHAFGDFCAQCHFGDPEAEVEATAHARVSSPLAAIDLSCEPCHERNARELADRYLHAPPPARARLVPRTTTPSRAANAVLAGLVALVGVCGTVYAARNERRLRSRSEKGPRS